MEFSRRWFLKSAAMVAVAAQLPMEEGHRILFIDNSPLLVTNYSQVDGFISAKVVNGAWDLVLDTHKKMLYAYSNAYSNATYGYDADCTTELKDSHPYKNLVEVRVSKSIGEVPEDMKPRTVMIPKYEEEPELQPSLENGVQVLTPVYMPVMKEVTRTWDNSDERYWVEDSFDGPGHWEQGGVLTMTFWEQETYPVVVDPLNGAGCDYNAIIQAAKQKQRSWFL